MPLGTLTNACALPPPDLGAAQPRAGVQPPLDTRVTQVPRKDGVPRRTYWSRTTINCFGRRCIGLAWHFVTAWYKVGQVVGDRILAERKAQPLAAGLAKVKEGEGTLGGRGLQDGESLSIATNFSLVLVGNRATSGLVLYSLCLRLGIRV